jgi:exodeoxyribonuclease VII large subunit
MEHIAQLSNRLEKKMYSMVELEISKVSALLSRPVMKDPSTIFSVKFDEIRTLQNDSKKAIASLLREAKIEVREVKARIAALSPLSTLKRGYAVVQKGGKVLLDAKDASPSDELNVVLAKGELTVSVLDQKRKKNGKG